MVECELPDVRIEVEELAVTAPVDGDPELLSSLVLGEAAPEEIEEEALTEIPVLGGLEGIADRTDERRSLACPTGEDLLRLENVGGHESPAVVGDLEVGVVHLGQSEDLRRVDEREQVVDLERQLMCELR